MFFFIYLPLNYKLQGAQVLITIIFYLIIKILEYYLLTRKINKTIIKFILSI